VSTVCQSHAEPRTTCAIVGPGRHSKGFSLWRNCMTSREASEVGGQLRLAIDDRSCQKCRRENHCKERAERIGWEEVYEYFRICVGSKPFLHELFSACSWERVRSRCRIWASISATHAGSIPKALSMIGMSGNSEHERSRCRIWASTHVGTECE
jgi:hypothetical protein